MEITRDYNITGCEGEQLRLAAERPGSTRPILPLTPPGDVTISFRLGAFMLREGENLWSVREMRET